MIELTTPVIFKESNHSYTLHGKRIPGTTTISGLMPKPGLPMWAAKEAINAILDHPEKDDISYTWILTEKERLIKAHLRKRDSAGERGTLFHSIMETYLRSGTVPLPKEYKSMQKIIDKVISYLSQYEILASEAVVGSVVHEYGGKIDLLVKKDNRITLIDFKTGGVYENSWIQQAGYKIALEEMGIRVDDRVILQVDLKSKVHKFEALDCPTPMTFDTEIFIALRNIQRYLSFTGQKK